MGKVEIKIRKKILTPDNLLQYRNYPALLKKYERTKRFRRALRIFLYSLALTVFVLALVFLGMWKVMMDKKQENSNIHKYVVTGSRKFDTLTLKLIHRNENDSLHTVVIDYGIEKFIDTLQFPTKESFNNWTDEKLVAEKTCLTNKKNFKVLKYNRNYDNISSFYYYSPDIGIVIFFYAASPHLANAQWKRELVKTGNQEIDKILPNLIQCIESDSSFYQNNFQ